MSQNEEPSHEVDSGQQQDFESVATDLEKMKLVTLDSIAHLRALGADATPLHFVAKGLSLAAMGFEIGSRVAIPASRMFSTLSEAVQKSFKV